MEFLVLQLILQEAELQQLLLMILSEIELYFSFLVPPVFYIISLWNQNDVRILTEKHSFSDWDSSKKWKTVEDRVTEKVPQLLLPQLLKEKVLGFIKPIGLEIFDWMSFHIRHYDLLLNLPSEFCWTLQGTVDRKKTAEVLIKNENLDLSTRYKLACIYCLEDDIIQLWNRLPEDLKESDWDKYAIISFWSHNMKGRRLVNERIYYKYRFCHYVRWYNKAAAEYFLQKLTPQEREDSLEKTANNIRMFDTHVLCFLLSKMDAEQRIKVFKNNTYRVLQSFLKWPLQSFYIQIANFMWNFLSKEQYDILLRDIIRKVTDGYKDYNYQNLFREFWQESPGGLKSLITNEIHTSWLLPSLFHIRDKESIRLVLKDTSLAVKAKLVYSYEMNTVCKRFIRENEWDFVEFYIQECFPSKNAMLIFKREFEKRMMHSYFKEHFITKKHKWNRLFLLTEDSISKYDKRSVEEGEGEGGCSLSKRFRSLQ